MGYGDGLASIVGERFGNDRSFTRATSKSIHGTATMFLASFLVVLVFQSAVGNVGSTLHVIIAAAATAAVAASVELATPFGLDNLTVPISTALFFFGLFA
jgi:phytol kinase